MPNLPWWTYWIVLFIALLVLGAASLLRKLLRIRKSLDFLEEYEQHYTNVISPTTKDDGESRTWLVTNAIKMMELMGAYGSLYSQVTGPINFAVNLIPDICFEIGQDGVKSFVQQERVNSASKCLLIFRGALFGEYESLVKRVVNPLRWLSEGTSLVLRIPIVVAQSVGLLSEDTSRKIVGSRVWEAFSGLASLATIAGFAVDMLSKLGMFQL